MKRSDILLKCKKIFKCNTSFFLHYRICILPIVLCLLSIPLCWVITSFKKEHGAIRNLYSRLKKIHLSQEKLSARQKKTPISLKSKLLSLRPLQKEKEKILSLKKHLPQPQSEAIEVFFEKNQLLLEKTEPIQEENTQHSSNKFDEHYKLMNPVLLHANEASQLITLIEAQECLAFSSFHLSKPNNNNHLLLLDFTFTVYNKND